MSEIINGKLRKSNYQRLEELYSWAALAGNGSNLAKPTIINETTFNKVQVEIEALRKKLFNK